MKYIDKNGLEWSPENGDWVGSFNRDEEEKRRRRFVAKLSIPFLMLLIISFILLF